MSEGEPALEFTKSKVISLKAHAEFNEKWLQQVIADDPSVLGLGDLIVKDIERRQPRAGRLDLLLFDPETLTRYEVEIQLGATDETHIIRTIEYWDIEKSRYPQYEHVAVIVAEDITSRFLNVINLLNKSIPLIAIQMNALDVGGAMTLTATTVLDLMRLGTDEDDEPGQAADRAYWVGRGSEQTVSMASQLLELINTVSPGTALKYNKHYIGLAHNGLVDNYVSMMARKSHLICNFRIDRSDEVTSLLANSDVEAIEYDQRGSSYRLRLFPGDLLKHRDLLLDLIRRSKGLPSQDDQ